MNLETGKGGLIGNPLSSCRSPCLCVSVVRLSG